MSKKDLIIYFSRPGENFVSGEIKNLKKGNTEVVAEKLKDLLDADIFKVETVSEYPNDYRETVERAKDEWYNQKKPDLLSPLKSVDEYENIYVLGPVWCGHYPMPLLSQLEMLDLDGKKIFPLVTHEGSGLAATTEDLNAACKNSQLNPGLAILGHEADQAETILEKWLN